MNPDEQAYFESIVKGIDDQLKVTSDWLGSDEAKEFFKQNQEELNKFFKDSDLNATIDELLEETDGDAEEFIKRFYEKGSQKGYDDIDRKLSYTSADTEALQHLIDYNYDLIKDVGWEFKSGLSLTLMNGVLSGKNPLQLIPEIEKLPLTPINSNISVRTRAEMIARTEYARAQNTGTLQAYTNYGVELVDILTARDNLVCKICLYYEANGPFTIKEAQSYLPAHPLCRCTYTANLGLDPVTKKPTQVLPEKPIETPPVVNLTDSSQAASSKLQAQLKDVVDDEDKKWVADNIISFKNQTDTKPYESNMDFDRQGKLVGGLNSDGNRGSTSMSFDAVTEGKRNGLGLEMHNHPLGASPIPSPADITATTVLRSKYAVVTSGRAGNIIIKNEGYETASDEFAVKKAMNQIVTKMRAQFKVNDGDYIQKIIAKEKIGKLTPKQASDLVNARFDVYTAKHTDTYAKMLKTKLGHQGFKVAYVTNSSIATNAGTKFTNTVKEKLTDFNPKKYKDFGDKIVDTMSKLAKDYKPSQDVQTAFTDYSGIGYNEINSYLRTGKVADDIKGFFYHSDSEMQKDINNMHDFIKTHTLGTDAVLYRGEQYYDKGKIPKYKEGEMGTFKAFTSTSLELGTGDSFHDDGGSGSILYKIYAGKDTHAVALDPDKNLSMMDGEGEILLDKNTKYVVRKVTDKTEGDSGYTLVELEIVNK